MPLSCLCHETWWTSVSTVGVALLTGVEAIPFDLALRRTLPIHLAGLTVSLALVAWAFVLRRRVRQRTFSLVEELRERRRAEQELRVSEERYRLLTENSHNLVSEMTPEGRYQFVNGNFETVMGYPPEQILGRTPLEAGMIHVEDWPRLVKAFNRTIARRSRTLVEFRGKSATGVYHWFECTTTCFQNSAGDWRVVAISRDITDQKTQEETLRQRQKLESLGLLAGGIAHDFNNLLTAMLGYLSLAESSLSGGSPAMPFLDSVQKTVLKASELCRQMLAYSGRGRFIVRPHDLNEVVQEMTHLVRVSLPKKVALRFKLQPALPRIEADAAQIQQVVMNLVTNAADAIGDHDGTIWITTRSQELDPSYIASTFPTEPLEPGPYTVLEVSDTGCGMSPEIQNRIFDPFFTTKRSGRGLGLSAMLGILRGHRAGIKIYSELGRGSTFKLFFPALGEIAVPQDAKSGELELNFSGTVLVVDDEAGVRESLCHLLGTLGFDVIPACDGEEAVEYFSLDPNRFDLVVMDLTMPRMDGREAFLAMRQLRSDIPVVLTSGYNEEESIAELAGRGPSAFLQKPWLVKDLKKTIASCLRAAEAITPS